jgi:uncharacterized protein YybS (DUF2232 family)
VGQQGGVPLPASASPRGEARPGVSGVVAAGAGSALLFAALLVHPVFLPLSVFSLFPLTLQRLRGGFGSGFLTALFSSSLLAGVFSPGQALLYVALVAVPGLLIAESMARGRGLRRGAALAFAALALMLSAGLFFASDRFEEMALRPFDQARAPEFLEQLKKSGWSSDHITEWVDQAALTRSVLAVVYPAAFVISAGFIVLANAALLRLYLARRDPGWLDGTELEGLRLPLVTAVLFVIAGGSVAFPLVRPAAYNVLLVLAFLFALQGLAVVSFYARRLAAPPFLRVAVVVLVLANPWAPQILGLMGLFDIWLDLRKYAEPPSAEAGRQ